jgi:hypothetical protein
VTVTASSTQVVEQQLAQHQVVTDAAQQVRLLLGFAARLELPRAFLASQELMERAEVLGRVVRDGQVKARQVHAEGMRRLVKGPLPIALSDVTDIVHETDPWLDANIEQGRAARAIDLAMTASRMCREQAFQAAIAETPGFYSQLQKIAANAVKDVARLKAPARQVWSGPDPAGQMVRDGRGDDWAVMVLAQDRFSLVHQAGQVVRSMGGLGAAGLLNGPPDLAFAYKRWDLAQIGEPDLRRLHPALRLRYALDQKPSWGPGLWLSSDVPDKPAVEPQGPRRGLVGLLVGPRS